MLRPPRLLRGFSRTTAARSRSLVSASTVFVMIDASLSGRCALLGIGRPTHQAVTVAGEVSVSWAAPPRPPFGWLLSGRAGVDETSARGRPRRQ